MSKPPWPGFLPHSKLYLKSQYVNHIFIFIFLFDLMTYIGTQDYSCLIGYKDCEKKMNSENAYLCSVITALCFHRIETGSWDVRLCEAINLSIPEKKNPSIFKLSTNNCIRLPCQWCYVPKYEYEH